MMLGQSKAFFTVTVILSIAVSDSDANAFQVFSNSRAGASANPTNTRSATGTMSRTNRNGLAGGLANKQWSYNSPNGQFRSNSYRRSTSSFGSPNQSPVFHNYNSGTLNRAGTSTYHSGPTRIQRRSGVASFSGPGYYNPYVPGFNGVAVGGIVVNGGFGNRHRGHHHAGPVFLVDPYGAAFSPFGNGYPWVPGGQVPFGIYAPPITVPYLNQGLNVNLGGNIGTNIVPNAGFIGAAPSPTDLLQQQPILQQPPAVAGANMQPPISIDEAAIVDEFPLAAAPTDTMESSTGNRIQSLRYQASADASYREADFASAAALYRSASKEAPERQAPWLRLAFTQVQMGNNAQAVQSLKAALNRNDDPTAAWVSATMLAGQSGSNRSSLSEEQLFDWLKQRPNSSDRLLLVAAWSEFRGSSSAAKELLQMAQNAGLSSTLASNLASVIADSHKAEVPERNKPEPKARTENQPAAIQAPIESFSDADIQMLPRAESKPDVKLPKEDDPKSLTPSLKVPNNIGT